MPSECPDEALGVGRLEEVSSSILDRYFAGGPVAELAGRFEVETLLGDAVYILLRFAEACADGPGNVLVGCFVEALGVGKGVSVLRAPFEDDALGGGDSEAWRSATTGELCGARLQGAARVGAPREDAPAEDLLEAFNGGSNDTFCEDVDITSFGTSVLAHFIGTEGAVTGDSE